jgi:hypothetical protein
LWTGCGPVVELAPSVWFRHLWSERACCPKWFGSPIVTLRINPCTHRFTGITAGVSFRRGPNQNDGSRPSRAARAGAGNGRKGASLDISGCGRVGSSRWKLASAAFLSTGGLRLKALIRAGGLGSVLADHVVTWATVSSPRQASFARGIRNGAAIDWLARRLAPKVG